MKKTFVHENEKFSYYVKEAFKTLRTNFLFSGSEIKSVLITSCVKNEGKSTVSLELAKSLSLSEKKVLLIDMDMRKPRISKLLKDKYDSSENKYGLSEYLVGIADGINIVNSKINNLSFLFSGAESPNPTGLLNSRKLVEMFKTCEEVFDYIIIDTPPVNVVSDALLLEKHINGYIIASRAEYSNVNAISDAIKSLNSVNADIFGFVLSDVNPKKSRKGKKYSSYNKYGYGYYDKSN